jgi:hypothetical protein
LRIAQYIENFILCININSSQQHIMAAPKRRFCRMDRTEYDFIRDYGMTSQHILTKLLWDHKREVIRLEEILDRINKHHMYPSYETVDVQIDWRTSVFKSLDPAEQLKSLQKNLALRTKSSERPYRESDRRSPPSHTRSHSTENRHSSSNQRQTSEHRQHIDPREQAQPITSTLPKTTNTPVRQTVAKTVETGEQRVAHQPIDDPFTRHPTKPAPPPTPKRPEALQLDDQTASTSTAQAQSSATSTITTTLQQTEDISDDTSEPETRDDVNSDSEENNSDVEQPTTHKKRRLIIDTSEDESDDIPEYTPTPIKDLKRQKRKKVKTPLEKLRKKPKKTYAPDIPLASQEQKDLRAQQLTEELIEKNRKKNRKSKQKSLEMEASKLHAELINKQQLAEETASKIKNIRKMGRKFNLPDNAIELAVQSILDLQ